MVLREKAYRIIKERIIKGEYRPGQPLNEKAIIEELSISRTPFREAIHALNEENLVQVYPNRGIFVREYSWILYAKFKDSPLYPLFPPHLSTG